MENGWQRRQLLFLTSLFPPTQSSKGPSRLPEELPRHASALRAYASIFYPLPPPTTHTPPPHPAFPPRPPPHLYWPPLVTLPHPTPPMHLCTLAHLGFITRLLPRECMDDFALAHTRHFARNLVGWARHRVRTARRVRG